MVIQRNNTTLMIMEHKEDSIISNNNIMEAISIEGESVARQVQICKQAIPLIPT